MYAYNPANIQFFRSPPSLEACLEKIVDAPYWKIEGKICYRIHSEPKYILVNYVPLEVTPELLKTYESYYAVYPHKKNLYAMSHYTLTQLKEMNQQLDLPIEGTKKILYEQLNILICQQPK